MTRRILSLIAGTIVLITIVGVYGVGWMLSRPVPAQIGAPPADLHAEDVAFGSASGSVIRGWLSRGTRHGGVVLLLPGVRANRLAMIERARFLRAAGYATLLIDFQATGESPGEAITFGWRERLDVIAAVTRIRQELPGERIGIIGTSLGGAATVLAARELDVQAAVLEAVYPSIDVAVENRLRMRLGSIGAAMSPLLLTQLRLRLGVAPSELRPVEHIASLRCPILIVGGDVDEHTTADDTRRLYAAARSPRELWLVPGKAHVDLLRAARDEYRRRVLTFLDRALRKEQADESSPWTP